MSAQETSKNVLTADQKFQLLRSVGEECITDEDLKKLLESKKPSIRCYDGFEPSGRLHIAQGLFKAINVNKCTTAGCTFVFWVADWFALMNDKMGGELSKIQTVGNYLIEVWGAAGMDMKNVEFLWSSHEINNHAAEYWRQVLDIGRRNTLARIKKCCQIMGRMEGNLTSAQILYPLMQCSDIFFLKADICQLGLDQRKVNMLAREYCDTIGRKFKPVILSHHMLAGLKQGQAKMSKSDPETAIFMEDSAEDVQRKIMNAYCPLTRLQQPSTAEVTGEEEQKTAQDKNPCLDYLQNIVFSAPGIVSVIIDKRTFSTYQELEDAFINKEFDEQQLKSGLAASINLLLEPIRSHFQTNDVAKELLKKIHEYRAAATTAKSTEAPTGDEVSATKTPVVKPHLLVYVPPTLKMELANVFAMIVGIEEFLAANADGDVTLLQPDWLAFARDTLTGEEKDINAVIDYNTGLLSAFGLPKQVKIVKQSAFILTNPDQYWLSVIGAGRKIPLPGVEAALGNVENAGQVVGMLMCATDLSALAVSHVLTSVEEVPKFKLLGSFYQETSGITLSILTATPGFNSLCRADKLSLEPDDCLFADDTDLDIRRKLKRAFAEPSNPNNCVVNIAGWSIQREGSVTVKRAEDAGGDLVYKSADALKQDYQQDALTPQLLKPAVSDLVLQWTKPARDYVGKPEIKKLSTILKNIEKKLSKKK